MIIRKTKITSKNKEKEYINIRNMSIQEANIIVGCLNSCGYDEMADMIDNIIHENIDYKMTDEDKETFDRLEKELEKMK